MKKWIWLIAVASMSLPLSGGEAIGGGTRVFAGDGFDCDIRYDGTLQLFVASGALGTVRSEPTGLRAKSIGCSVDAFPGHAMVTCLALSDSSDYPQLACVSQDPTLVAMVASMNSDSFLTFFTPVNSSTGVGTCTHITVENNSMYNVKSP